MTTPELSRNPEARRSQPEYAVWMPEFANVAEAFRLPPDVLEAQFANLDYCLEQLQSEYPGNGSVRRLGRYFRDIEAWILDGGNGNELPDCLTLGSGRMGRKAVFLNPSVIRTSDYAFVLDRLKRYGYGRITVQEYLDDEATSEMMIQACMDFIKETNGYRDVDALLSRDDLYSQNVPRTPMEIAAMRAQLMQNAGLLDTDRRLPELMHAFREIDRRLLYYEEEGAESQAACAASDPLQELKRLGGYYVDTTRWDYDGICSFDFVFGVNTRMSNGSNLSPALIDDVLRNIAYEMLQTTMHSLYKFPISNEIMASRLLAVRSPSSPFTGISRPTELIYSSVRPEGRASSPITTPEISNSFYFLDESDPGPAICEVRRYPWDEAPRLLGFDQGEALCCLRGNGIKINLPEAKNPTLVGYNVDSRGRLRYLGKDNDPYRQCDVEISTDGVNSLTEFYNQLGLCDLANQLKSLDKPTVYALTMAIRQHSLYYKPECRDDSEKLMRAVSTSSSSEDDFAAIVVDGRYITQCTGSDALLRTSLEMVFGGSSLSAMAGYLVDRNQQSVFASDRHIQTRFQHGDTDYLLDATPGKLYGGSVDSLVGCVVSVSVPGSPEKENNEQFVRDRVRLLRQKLAEAAIRQIGILISSADEDQMVETAAGLSPDDPLARAFRAARNIVSDGNSATNDLGQAIEYLELYRKYLEEGGGSLPDGLPNRNLSEIGIALGALTRIQGIF